jgi:hypothetical protein
VILLLLAVSLPGLFWDKGPETAAAIKQAHFTNICVPPSRAQAWQGMSGVSVGAVDISKLVKLPAPGVQYRINEASATRAPWVDSNGWRYLRGGGQRFYSRSLGNSAGLSAAEAYTFCASLLIDTDPGGLEPLGEMVQFLDRLPKTEYPRLANFDFIDDGSQASAEFMNLLIRRNLLFRLLPPSERSSPQAVALGTPDFPKSEAGNPSLLAEKVRSRIGDYKRLVRIYGGETVIGQLTGVGGRARLLLLNYDTRRPVEGIRIRILGEYRSYRLASFANPDLKLLDYTGQNGATEFTIPVLKIFAVVDLAS